MDMEEQQHCPICQQEVIIPPGIPSTSVAPVWTCAPMPKEGLWPFTISVYLVMAVRGNTRIRESAMPEIPAM
jgi:hypothetical protein